MAIPASVATRFRLLSRSKGEIHNMEEWREKREAVNAGWVPGKSAWETANAWVGSGEPVVAKEFRMLLDSHSLTSKIALGRGIVERKTSLRYGSGPRNHDLLLLGGEQTSECVIGVESKANDGFDGTMQGQIQLARKIHQENKPSNRDLRTHWLSDCLLGVPLLTPDRRDIPNDDDKHDLRSEVLGLPFQLFAGVAGTMLEANACHAKMAIFAVHQFRTQFTNDTNIEADARHMDRFVTLLIRCNVSRSIQTTGSVSLDYGKLVGPIYLEKRDCEKRWTMPSAIPLLIGKVLTERVLPNDYTTSES